MDNYQPIEYGKSDVSWFEANVPSCEFSQADGITLAEASDRIPVYTPQRRLEDAGRQSEFTRSLETSLRGDVSDWKRLAQHWKRRAELNAMLVQNADRKGMDGFLVGLFYGILAGILIVKCFVPLAVWIWGLL